MGARYDKGRQLFCKSVGGLLGLGGCEDIVVLEQNQPRIS